MGNTPQKIEVGQHVQLDRTPMMTSTAECLATESYNKLLHTKTEPFSVVEVTPTTVTIEEEAFTILYL